MKPEGLFLVISAPSGAGKSTLIRMLCREFPDFGFSISYTTRQPRPDEVHGREYFFVSRDEFLELKAGNFFAEWAEVHGNFYGTPKDQILQSIDQGQNLILDVDVQGARQIKENINRGVFLFVFPPSLEELRNRLKKRGSEKDADIDRRLENAVIEMLANGIFDYWLVNDDIDRAYEQLRSLVLAEKLRPERNPGLPQKIAAGKWF